MNNKDRDFEIELAKIGMKFGGAIALGVAIFAIGGTLFFSTLEHAYLLSPSFLLFLSGMAIIFYAVGWSHKAIDELKKKFMENPDNTPKKELTYKNCFILLLLCKRYDGIER